MKAHCATVLSVDEQTHERTREVIAAVPAGSVATYGDIARIAGLSTPRMVGWILRADGSPAAHLREEQLARLRAEGVLAQGSRVDLTRYRWQGPERSAPGHEGQVA